MGAKNFRRVIALVPLRGGSQSIRYKNIKPIADKPLAYWVLKAATDAPSINKVYVSTEDPQIKNAVKALRLGVEVIDRPYDLATDLATTDSVMGHFMEKVPDFDILFTIQATSPLTTAKDLERALEQLEAGGHDSLLTGVPTKRFIWSKGGEPLNYDYRNRPMRQHFDGSITENGAFYITRKPILEQHKNRLGGNIGIYEMHPDLHTELDEPTDWEEVEKMLKKRY